MRNAIKLLKVDYITQKLLLFVTCCSIVFFPLIGVMLCILGGWQLLSAIIIGYTLKDKKRLRYFSFSVLYLFFMWGSLAICSSSEKGFEMVALAVIFIVIPIFIALWYMKLTSETLDKLRKEEYIYLGREGLEDILDSDELLERRAIMDL